jgi:anaerobic selenocysteine-containing dehydrogenase
VLPATGQLERADITLFTMAVPSRAQATGAVVAPIAERRPIWWSLGSLARRMGVDLLGGVDPDQLTEEQYVRGALAHSATVDADALLAGGPHGIDIPVEHGWVHERLPEGRWRLTPEGMLDRLAACRAPTDGLVLTPRREMGWVNSVRYGGPEEPALVRLHPADAGPAGLAPGATAVVRSAHGSLIAGVALDDNVRRGVVSITHGRLGQSAGHLTSSSEDVDPLTAMPKASGVAVTISSPPVAGSSGS